MTSVITSSILLGGFLSAETAFAVGGKLSLRDIDRTDPVPVTPVGTERPGGRDDAARDSRKAAPGVTWPAAGTAEVRLDGSGNTPQRAGKLPVRIGRTETGPTDKARTAAGRSDGTGEPDGGGRSDGTGRAKDAGRSGASGRAAAPAAAQVQVLDRKAADRLGIDGVLLAVRAKDGGEDASVRVSLDYSKFEHAFGAGWASRLSLVRLPSCALESAGTEDCGAGTPLTTDNDAKARTLTADVPVDATAGGSEAEAGASDAPVRPAARGARSLTGLAAGSGVTLLAATAGPSGSSGDYKATPLSPSGNWVAGDSSGTFGWAYEIQTPEVPGGLEPELNLGYSSQSLDGRTAATNNQANAIGDGWALTENYIERRYLPCNDDMTNGNNKAKNGDLCYGPENATMSLDGQSHELVRDDKTGTWKLKDDDGTRIELLADTARGNGDNDGEHWRVTTTDGTQYHFGYNRLPGWSSGKAETNSTWTVPVYGNQSGEPCYKSAFADSWCQQAWRWNLDYVVDTNANATAYYYNAEKNRYGRNVSATTGLGTPTEYTRGGHPDRIEYGLRSDNLYAADAAAAKVGFTVAERCLPDASFDCAPAKMTTANAKRWPDVPVDQECKAGEDCKNRIAPTFWTTKRLTRITTTVLSGSGAGASYQPVDSWEFRHELPDPGDGSPASLWLAGITRTGHTGGSPQALPEITFKGTQLANRVDSTGDGIPPLVRYRVGQIDTETGGSLGITYSAPDCAPGSLPAETSNTRRCYPVYWSSADSPAADYKPVKDWFHKYVVTRVLENDLVGGSPTEQTDYTYVGGAAWAKSEDEFTKAEHRTYSDYRGYGEVRTQDGNGVDGPKLDSRTRYFRGIAGAKVADFEGNEVADHASFQAMERAEITYNGAEVVSEETSTPWRSAVTATRARPGLPALESDMTGVQQETTRSPAKGGGWQRTKTERTFDAYGMVVTETDHGDTSKTGDETCDTTTYARNTAANILELEATEKSTAGTCAAPGEPISENRSYYDGSTTLGAAPTKGNATREDENDAEGTGFFTAARTTYDLYGRPLAVTDSQNRTMTTEYVPATGTPTSIVTTNPLGHTLTTEIDPRRGVPAAEVDANGKRTELGYDALGRLTGIWEPGRTKARFPDHPDAGYSYRISTTEPPVVTTRELRGDGSTETSHEIYDGLLRERQTQVPSLSGTGRVLTETLYDSRGLEWKSYDDYYATGDPEPKLVAGDDTKAPAAVRTVYDAAGRPTDAIALKYGTETRRTRTVYDGNHTTLIPPKGGTASTTVTDPQDRPVEVVEYTNEARTASQSITYAYDERGLLKTVTDPEGNVRKFEYDGRGRETRADDPDSGTLRTSYDSLDRPVSTTDARGVTLTAGYDELGRRTSLREGDKVLSEWTYDTVAKGEISESRRYVDGHAYAQRITGYTDDYLPTKVEVTVPESEGALAGTYSIGYAYDPYTGLPTAVNQPPLGGMPAERVVTRYGADDQAQGLTAGARILVNSSTYDPFGRPLRTEYNDAARRLYRTASYDEHTGELLRTTTDRTAAPSRVDDTTYGYDAAGNVTRITTVTGQDAAKQTDTQCFTMDALQRLTEAWTSREDCAAAPDPSNVGGPKPYWLSYSYDALGNRTKEVRHDVGSAGTAGPAAAVGTAGAAGDGPGDAVRTYAYGKPDGAKPAAVTSVRTERDGVTTSTDTFGYDAMGNTTTRKTDGRDQTLVWDAENQLVKVQEAGRADVEYVYDADGGRLLRKDLTGTTLYLPGGNELLLQPDGKKTGTRYYDFDGETVAARTGGTVQFLFDDHHGTASTAIDATTQDVLYRSTAPFGEERGSPSASPVTWPVDQGFVGGTKDSTGLTQLGARAYDPKLGRFLSVDPMTDLGESQRMNAYAYANNNPATFSDPDGLFWGKIKKAVKKAAKKVTKTVKKVAKKAKKVVKKAVKKVVKTVKKVVKKATKVVKRAVKKVARVTKKVIKRATYTVKKYAKKTYRAVKKTYRATKSVVKRAGSKVASATKRVAKATASGVKSAAKQVTLHRVAKVLGHVSTITGTAAGLFAMVPVLAPAAATFGAISAATGVASAGAYALDGDKSAAVSQLAGTAAAVMLGGAGSTVRLIRGSGAVARGARTALSDGLAGVGGKLMQSGGKLEKGVGAASIGLHTTAANVGGWIGLRDDARSVMAR
ncbi:RHS repeat-associated core domain-containing protein [Streptomyces sp. NRRL F-5135]|uniref:RHS repeat-associated core domain-containing protein n=1 Tax=Streptomyces sp. NRRL F-5135 TaxID=1463858 RepID=UPI00068F77D1|nr:RHS repeat-associated core domain-containing protein [Streptomyces sp. NRRL F-5135]